MPIYEYQCRKCGTFEVTQRITEEPLRRCPKCKGKVSRLLSAPSFQFKGSGWYVTDYAKGSGGGRGEKKNESSDSKGSESSSESKPAPDAKPAKESSSSSKDSKASKAA